MGWDTTCPIYLLFSHSCCWLSLRDVWWDQPISHSVQNVWLLSLISPFQMDIFTRKYIQHCWRRLISALVTASSTRLKARAWCGDLCWDEPISPYPTMLYAYIPALLEYLCYGSPHICWCTAARSIPGKTWHRETMLSGQIQRKQETNAGLM